MHCYETIYILHPDLGDEAVDAAKARVEDALTATGGRIYQRENWGKKRLAYPIAKQQRGFYQLIRFIGDGRGVADIERLFRLDEAFIKHLIVRLKQDPATAEAQAEEAAAKAAERAAEKASEKGDKPARAKARPKPEGKAGAAPEPAEKTETTATVGE